MSRSARVFRLATGRGERNLADSPQIRQVRIMWIVAPFAERLAWRPGVDGHREARSADPRNRRCRRRTSFDRSHPIAASIITVKTRGLTSPHADSRIASEERAARYPDTGATHRGVLDMRFLKRSFRWPARPMRASPVPAKKVR